MKKRTQRLPTSWLIYFGLGLITLALYLPALHHGFVEYDDQQYVTENPRVQAGLTWRGLRWAFGFYAGNWHPLTWWSHMLDCQLFAANAGGHHLTSVLLHVASTLLLFSVAKRMTGMMWRSAAVAALFAWHPLHVESVAWVAERKDVLCGFFWMLTLWCYVRFTAQPSPIRYFFTLGSFVLCLMAKPMGVTLPFVLLLLDYWPLKRISSIPFQFSNLKTMLLEKIPFLALSAIACGLTMRAQQIAIVSTAGLTIPQRIAHVFVAYNHYIVAMFVPRHLAVYYPYQMHLAALPLVGAVIGLGLVTLLAAINWRQRPYLIIGWLWYLGTLVPVIGLVQVGDQAWADRYTYLPLIGLFIALVWITADFIKEIAVLRSLSVVVALSLMITTSLQLGYWRNTRTLFEHANQVTPNNFMAITVLGSLLAKEHKYAEAMACYQQALRYEPTFPEAHFFMGDALDEQGKLDEAIAEYQQALWFKPTQEQTHIFIGIALGKQKKYEEAMAHYQAALKINPDSAVAQNNLARILHTLGRFDEAVAHYHAALEIDPKLELAQNNLGVLLVQQGQLAEGTRHLREALRLKPGDRETEFNLALALNQQQQWGEAADLFQKNLTARAADPKVHAQLAVALLHLNKTREAMSQYASALLIQPDFPEALNGLAWILSTDVSGDNRNGNEAVKMAERAVELSQRNDPEILRTLAAAYAETGRFEEANKTIKQAAEIAGKLNTPQLAKDCADMLECFQKSKPWRSR